MKPRISESEFLELVKVNFWSGSIKSRDSWRIRGSIWL